MSNLFLLLAIFGLLVSVVCGLLLGVINFSLASIFLVWFSICYGCFMAWLGAAPIPCVLFSASLVSLCYYSELPPCGHLAITDTSLLRTPSYYGQQLNPRRKLQTFDWNKLPLLRTLAITDLRTLYSVPMSQFYCFLSRYSGHAATSWNICVHIKSIFSSFWDYFCLVCLMGLTDLRDSRCVPIVLIQAFIVFALTSMSLSDFPFL